jgi:hypothetical protein
MKRKKAVVVVLIVIAVIVLAGIGLKLGWNYTKKDLEKAQHSAIKPAFKDEVTHLITAASDSLYQFQFDTFTLSIDSGKGLVRNLRLIADSGIYQKLSAQHTAPNMMMNMKADSLLINHFSFENTKDGKQFVVDSLLIKNPFIKIDYGLVDNYIPDTSSSSLLATAVKKLLQLSMVNHFEMKSADLEMVAHNSTTVKKTLLKNLDISMDSMDIKNIRSNDSSGDHVLVHVANYRLTTADKLYDLKMHNLRFEPAYESLLIEKTVVEPRYGKEAFFKNVSKANDRYYIVYNNMQMQGIDMQKLLHKQQIKIRKMETSGSFTEIYTDYNLRKRKPPVRKYCTPHEMLQHIAFDITIDTMLNHNGKLRYKIKARRSGKTTLFTIDDMETKAYNITNDSEAKSLNHYVNTITTGRVMNAANITTIMKFNVASKNGAFKVQNIVQPMDATVLNPLTKPLAMMEIKSLDVQKMVTVIEGDEQAQRGEIDFYYKNMKVSMLKKKDGDYKKMGVVSFLSNVFIPDDNPKKNGKFRKGIITAKRQPTDSFWGFLWQGTFNGMVSFFTGEKKEDLKDTSSY